MRYKYNILNYDLTNGLAEEIQVPGGFIYVKDASDANVKVAVRPDSKSNDLVYLKKQFGVVVEFRKLYITADAQSGKTVEIVIANSYDTFRIFEQAQTPDIATVGSITDPVTIQNPTIADILKIGGTTQTGYDLLGQMQKYCDPSHGTEIAKSASIIQAVATSIIHTVTAGKVLVLEAATINFYGTGASFSLHVRNESDVVQYAIFEGATEGANFFSGNILIPAGYDICLNNTSATRSLYGFLKGREI
ncbi:MAG: hypothetical protein A2X55_07760 [Nitrospirae bacterium GWB2_47_37]|nr:MAG: hypothetical protein A2X55_07760 [Nitrospirae bacterium GWB2_47_37]